MDLGEDEPGELVDGYLEDEEMPDAVHELAVTWLTALVRMWLGASGFVFGSEVKLAIFQKTGRKADISVYLPGRAAPPRRGPLTDPPDVVVEVVTPTPRDERRDRVEKMEEYARFGVRWYWIVDPALGTFEIFSLEADGRYKKSVGVTQGVIDPVPGCEGLRLDVDALWTELTRLADESER
jgi:Uma2 family endonuclease